MSKEKSTSIKVVVRFRPLINLELELGDCKQDFFKFSNETSVSILKDSTPENFVFDRAFSPSTNQVEIFEFIGRPIIEDVLAGYNGTVFAYGQTGSGKTHTMMGIDIFDETSRGLIPRAISLIFTSLSENPPSIEYTIKCSMLEIYKENLKDLLMIGPKLRIKENSKRGIYVDGLSEVYVTSEEEVLNALAVGEKNRSIASTKMNQQSSRSHQIFIIEVSQKLLNDTTRRGTLNLVDLAGCEKISQTGATGEKLEEAKKINLSLSALGNVIHALTSRADHIPYRDSKLTRLLQESLGGNYKTTLVVNCSPHPRNIEDSLNTLKFAQRAKTIKNSAKINVTKSIDAYVKSIAKLKKKLSIAKEEIKNLKEIIVDHGGLMRSNTMMVEPLTPLTPMPDFGYENTSDLALRIEQLNEQIDFLTTDNRELRGILDEKDAKIIEEQTKRVKSEEKAIGFYNSFQDLLNSEKEKENNVNNIMSSNKRLEAQVQYLSKLLTEFSQKFIERLTALQNGKEIEIYDFFNSKLDEIQKELNEPMKSPEKYFPEAIKISQFFSASSQITKTDEILLKKRLVESEVINCELNVNYWNLVWKYNILRENYSSIYSNFDLQKHQISSLKKTMTQLQTSYSKIIGKMNKLIQNGKARPMNCLNLRKPVNNAVPMIFEAKDSDRSEFLRKASLFHLLTNGLEGGVSQNSLRSENFNQKTIENNLIIQSLLSKQLKSNIVALKEENQRLKSLCDSSNTQARKCENLENGKISKILKELHVIFGKHSEKVNFESISKNSNVKEIDIKINTHLRTESRENMHKRLNSEELKEASFQEDLQDTLTPKILSRTQKKALTLAPNNWTILKSSLSKTFIKTQVEALERKDGDLSP